MTSIADLIKRVEGAQGPDREIDRLIMPIAGYVLEQRLRDKKAWWYRATTTARLSDELFAPYGGIPRYTASVDAVISLIGEKIGTDEAEWYVGRPSVDGLYRAGVRGHTGGLTDDVTGEAPAPALALLLAFLRAWEQRGNG